MNEANEIISKNNNESSSLHTIGFICSILLALVTTITFIIAVFTPPISGPFSAGVTVTYPYTNIFTRFPRDYYWMYPAMLLVLIYVVYMVCVNQNASKGRKLYSQTALLFACLAAGILFVNYFIQVTVIQPSLMKGEFDGIALLTQYNPHGLFIALEEAGYVIMSIAILFLAPVFAGTGKIRAALRWTSVLTFTFTVLSLIIISIVYGISREYRFEVAVITFDFLP